MIYLDHAASTPMRPEAVAAMMPFLSQHPGNPSGSHAASRITKTALEAARHDVAQVLGCDDLDVVFTGGGSEADNLAIKGAAYAARERGIGDGVVTTGIEHKAVLGAVERLRHDGFRTSTVAATRAGVVDLDGLADALDEQTVVVSVMLVNNETGIAQPLDDVAALVHERAPRAVLHTDAVQAPQWLDVGDAAEAADLVAISGHKFGGPKGVGVLLRRNRLALVPLIEGGGHELGARAGTQNVAGIVALATALRVTHAQRTEEVARIATWRDELEAGLASALGSGFAINGDRTHRVAGFIHAAFQGIEAEALLVALDAVGVCAASGSACSSGAIDPSHVLLAMGLPREQALSSVRFSLGWATTHADIVGALELIPTVVARLTAHAAA